MTFDIRTVSFTSPGAPAEFARSLSETGFAVLTDHPIAPDRIEATYAAWGGFFASEDKHDWLPDPARQDGYFPFRSEHAKGAMVKDLKEFYHVYPDGKVPGEVAGLTRALHGDLVAIGQTLLGWIDDNTPDEVRGRFSEPLPAMLEGRTRVREEDRVAGIMSVSANPFRHDLVIDKGRNDGVYDGQAMVDAEGVVGQVIETGLFSAQAVLISDPDHALPVEINRNGLRTIAVGTGEFDRLDLPFLPNNADVRQGDLLVTSGLGGAFPAGYPVAIIDNVTRVPQEPFAAVSARPAAKLNQIREIMLIWSIAGEDDPETPE